MLLHGQRKCSEADSALGYHVLRESALEVGSTWESASREYLRKNIASFTLICNLTVKYTRKNTYQCRHINTFVHVYIWATLINVSVTLLTDYMVQSPS